MHRFALAVWLVVSPPLWANPPEAGPLVRIPKALAGKVGDLIEIKAESGAELVTWDVSDGGKLLYPRPYDPAHKSVSFHAAAPGTFAVVASIPNGKETRVDICLITISGDGKPEPKPDPAPPPHSSPVGFVVIIEETGEGVATRGALLADAALQARLKAKSIGWRVADKDVRGANGQPPADLVPYLDRAKGKKLPQVFLIGTDRTILHQGDLPSGAAGLVDLLGKYGG